MYITDRADVSSTIMDCGIDRIFVDMEVLGKSDRQGGMNTVQSRHTVESLREIKAIMPEGRELLVRTNPPNETLKQQVDEVIEAGADIVMLPFFHTASDVENFVEIVGGRAKVSLLLENRESVIDNIDEILMVEGVDEYYIGLNDLNLSLGGKFMFEPMANGILDTTCEKLRATGKPFGFGGIAKLDGGLLSGSRVLAEHYRLGSSIVIVSRSFCNLEQVKGLSEVEEIFSCGIKKLREAEDELSKESKEFFEANHSEVKAIIKTIIDE